jgi:hypothetical protein
MSSVGTTVGVRVMVCVGVLVDVLVTVAVGVVVTQFWTVVEAVAIEFETAGVMIVAVLTIGETQVVTATTIVMSTVLFAATVPFEHWTWPLGKPGGVTSEQVNPPVGAFTAWNVTSGGRLSCSVTPLIAELLPLVRRSV